MDAAAAFEHEHSQQSSSRKRDRILLAGLSDLFTLPSNRNLGAIINIDDSDDDTSANSGPFPFCSVLHSGSPRCNRRPPDLPKWCLAPMESLHGSNVFRTARRKILEGKGVGVARFGDSFIIDLDEDDIKDFKSLNHYTINHKNEQVVQRLKQGVDYHSLPPDDIPKLKNMFNLKKCIVVGSSSSLTGSGLGPTIDSYPTIIRFNEAPTIGFEADVGSRTTFRIQNPSRAGTAEKDEWCLIKGFGERTLPRVEEFIQGSQLSRPGTVTRVSRFSPEYCQNSLKPDNNSSSSNSYNSSDNSSDSSTRKSKGGWFSRFRYPRKPEPRCNSKLELFNRFMIEKSCWSPCKNMVTLSPQFVQYTKVFWNMIRPPNASSASALVMEDPPKMSSGFQGITLALSICNSVTIVGFGQGAEYYFKKCPKKNSKEFSGRHAWDLEFECLDLLKEKNLIKVL